MDLTLIIRFQYNYYVDDSSKSRQNYNNMLHVGICLGRLARKRSTSILKSTSVIGGFCMTSICGRERPEHQQKRKRRKERDEKENTLQSNTTDMWI